MLHTYSPVNYVELPMCLACGANGLIAYLDLGRQCLANSYHNGSLELNTYPLALQRCAICEHSQLSISIDPKLLFDHYLYVSGTTSTLREYFSTFARAVESEHRGTLRVLDIASNDGSLLREFIGRGHSAIGVDPAKNLADVARSNGVDTVCSYWPGDVARSFMGEFDVVVAMNVLAHVPDPLSFLIACKEALRPGGSVYIQTSQCRMLANGEFDAVYHEHISYFTAKSFHALASRAGLRVVSGTIEEIHGGSYLWRLVPLADLSQAQESTLLHAELQEGRYESETYRKFAKKAKHIAKETKRIVEQLRQSGYSAIGYGAAAKGNTFLNFAQIDLEYIVDDNELKVGLFTPGRNIPIKRTSAIVNEQRPLAIVILAWNFADEIRHRVRALRPTRADDVFVRYFPEPSID